MKNTLSPPIGTAVARGLGLLFAGIFAVLVFGIVVRNAGLYPVVFADEYTYSSNARLKPLADASIPIYLYLSVYRATSLCGDGFLACARLFNVAFLVAAIPFIVLVARRVVPLAVAVAIGLLALASPYNSYTAYFMPESMYYFGFWCTIWLASSLTDDGGHWQWLRLGAAVGLLALIKPHALFLLPALLIYGAAVLAAGRRVGIGKGAFALASLAVLSLAIKLLVGWFLAGRPGLTLFGAFYNGVASAATLEPDHYLRIARATVFSVAGHAMTLVLLYAMPIAFIVATVAVRPSKVSADPGWRVCVLTALIVASLVAVACVFTASVAGSGPYETFNRLHLRYYNFAFPLFLIVGGSALNAPSGRLPRARIAILAIGACVLAVAYVGFARYAPDVVDSPEIFGIATHRAALRFTALLTIVALGLLWWRPKYAAIAFLFVAMPWIDLKEAQYAVDIFKDRLTANDYDRAGLLARQSLTRQQAGRVRVMGDDLVGLYRALFYLDSPNATFTLLKPGEPVTQAMWAIPCTWTLVVGDHAVEGDAAYRIVSPGITLSSTAPPDWDECPATP